MMEGLSVEKREGRGRERERESDSSPVQRDASKKGKERSRKVGRLTTEVEGFERVLQERDGNICA